MRGERPVRMSATTLAINVNESGAQSTVINLNTAELTYRTSYATQGYAGDLVTLGSGVAQKDCMKADARHACLVNSTLGCASPWCIKDGYRFNVSTSSKSPPIGDYTTTATPVDSNTGSRNFAQMRTPCLEYKWVHHYRASHLCGMRRVGASVAILNAEVSAENG